MASSSSWAILATIPRVSRTDADLSLALAAPPGVSVLTVPPRVSPDPVTDRNFPSVLAADPSGLILLHATQGERTGPLVFGDRGLSWRPFVDGYFVCNHAPTAAAARLPDPQGNRVLDAGNLGLVTAQDGGATFMFMVAELQPIIGTDLATLLCYSSTTGLWEEKSLSYPLEGRPWGSHGVVSYLGRLWWIDVSWGLLTCLPFDDEPDLQFVPLPGRKKLPFQCNQLDLQKYRCLQVSDGALRFVDIAMPDKPRVVVNRIRNVVRRHGHRKVPWVLMWTLYDPEAGLWRREHEVSFDDIWSHETFKATGLPKNKVPRLALVDPADSDVVYFFLDEYLFSVNLRERSVLKCVVYNLDHPPRERMSSRFVRAWELPRALSCSGSCQKVSDSRKN